MPARGPAITNLTPTNTTIAHENDGDACYLKRASMQTRSGHLGTAASRLQHSALLPTNLTDLAGLPAFPFSFIVSPSLPISESVGQARSYTKLDQTEKEWLTPLSTAPNLLPSRPRQYAVLPIQDAPNPWAFCYQEENMPTAVLVDGAFFIKRFRRIEPQNAFNAEQNLERYATTST
ncbi:hypothetical protein [Pseudomonas helmanticensis]|uniref:hypothetical protein n=1 Tax=Pseudomonas helmanticensis TaxID=1471381 RepID=UPI0024B81598|nr:hypothetical protein [Pseudomonas helmanticensis]